MIVHIPHSQTYPFQGIMDEELNNMTDLYTDDLFEYKNSLIFPFSRLMCDVERFVDDSMETKGMGMCYTHTSNCEKFREVTPYTKEQVRKFLYEPHHKQLELMVEEELREKGNALIVDAHSFPAVPLPYEDCQERPDICIGTNEHTSLWLENFANEYFLNLGYSVMVNKPFAGAIVPMKYYKQDARVQAIMIEINRGLYLRNDYTKADGYIKVREDLQYFLKLLEQGV